VNQIRYSDYLGSGLEGGGKILGGISTSLSYSGFRPTWYTWGGSFGFSAGTYVGLGETVPLNK